MKDTPELQTLALNTIRYLSAASVHQAKSGHPGLPLGAADIALVLWSKAMKHNPAEPLWPPSRPDVPRAERRGE